MKKNGTKPLAQETVSTEKKFSLISDETLTALYVNLLKGRALNLRTHMEAKGWEAAVVGVSMDLVGEDDVFCTDASPLPRFLHGEPLRHVLQGTVEEKVAPAKLSHQLTVALGTALMHKTRKDGKLSVIFWREGEQDSWRDALEAARAHTLPMIFVCQSALGDKKQNGTDLKNGKPGPRIDKTLPADYVQLPSITVDGADVVAVYRVAHEAIERARKDRGPTLIECVAFHVSGSMNGKKTDSVENMETYLSSKGLLQPELRQKTEDAFEQALDIASVANAAPRRMR